MSTQSSGPERIEIDPEIFGHRVVGTLTGREMSTPDVHKPELVEVQVQRTDDEPGVFWVPRASVSPLTYEVKTWCHQEGFGSPTDAVLSMIDWLRSPMPGGITFTVRSVEDNVTYDVEATQDDNGAWSAEVTGAVEPDRINKAKPVVRHDLIPIKE